MNIHPLPPPPEPPDFTRARTVVHLGCAAFLALSGLGIALWGLSTVLR